MTHASFTLTEQESRFRHLSLPPLELVHPEDVVTMASAAARVAEKIRLFELRSGSMEEAYRLLDGAVRLFETASAPDAAVHER